MKSFYLILFLGFLSIPAIKASDDRQIFGTVNLDELMMRTYDRDNKAEAVVIYDVGSSHFTLENNGFRMIYERTTRIKIFNKAGLDYAQVDIPFYFTPLEIEIVYDIEGYTYNINGKTPKVTKFNPENVYEEKQSNQWRIKKFALPDVKEGSVIEFRYKISSPFSMSIRDWDFQYSIPVIYSEYTTRMIPYFEYTYLLRGASGFDVFNRYRDQSNLIVSTFGMKNVPALRLENYVASVNDYIIRVNFQLAAMHYPNGAIREIKWSSLISDMLKVKGFGMYMNSFSSYANHAIRELKIDSVSVREKTEAIYRYVANNYIWDGVEDKMAHKSRRKFLKEKTGNCAEINLFLVAMLDAAGIESYPVLISTRSHGKIPDDKPFLQFLNYVVVLARTPGQNILMDATEPLGLFGILPSRCLNEKGILVKKDQVDWIILEDNSHSEISDSVMISFNEGQGLLLTAHRMEVTGHDALRLRRNYANDPVSLEDEFLTDGMELIRPFSIYDAKMYENPLAISFTTTSDADRIGNKLLVFPFAGLTLNENPLKLPFHTNPLVVNLIYKWSRRFTTTIEIPEGYRCYQKNKELTIENELVGISYEMDIKESHIEVKGSYVFKKPNYGKEEYDDIRESFNHIVNAFNEPVILEKN